MPLAEDKERTKALDNALTQIEKDFGKGSIMRLGERGSSTIDAIPTGAISLDAALGVGGMPRGRVVEIFGPESSGKTTLALEVIAQAQKSGGMAAFVDAEHALDAQYATKLGVDIDNLLVSQPDYGEQALEIVERLTRSNSLDVIVDDSVAALVPRSEIEGEMGWGIANDTFSVSEEYKKFIPQNFSIGDKDLALNLYRNQLLSEGKSLTEITKLFAEHLNLECNLIPMTDDTVSTKLKTDDGSLLDFQEYFVEKKAKPKLTEVVYNGSEKAKVSDQLIKKIEESEIVVIGPSNPILSIGPILSLNKLKEKLSEHNNVYVINPFIENKAIKGPSKNNFEDLGYTSDIQGIKNFYKDVGNKYIVHPGDSDGAEDTVEHNILFNELENSIKLVEFIVNHE